MNAKGIAGLFLLHLNSYLMHLECASFPDVFFGDSLTRYQGRLSGTRMLEYGVALAMGRQVVLIDKRGPLRRCMAGQVQGVAL